MFVCGQLCVLMRYKRVHSFFLTNLLLHLPLRAQELLLLLLLLLLLKAAPACLLAARLLCKCRVECTCEKYANELFSFFLQQLTKVTAWCVGVYMYMHMCGRVCVCAGMFVNVWVLLADVFVVIAACSFTSALLRCAASGAAKESHFCCMVKHVAYL